MNPKIRWRQTLQARHLFPYMSLHSPFICHSEHWYTNRLLKPENPPWRYRRGMTQQWQRRQGGIIIRAAGRYNNRAQLSSCSNWQDSSGVIKYSRSTWREQFRKGFQDLQFPSPSEHTYFLHMVRWAGIMPSVGRDDRWQSLAISEKAQTLSLVNSDVSLD